MYWRPTLSFPILGGMSARLLRLDMALIAPALVELVNTEMFKTFKTRTTCVESAAVTLGILRNIGVGDGFPLAVEAHALNRLATKGIEASVSEPPAGSSWYSIGDLNPHVSENDSWNGHVVTIAGGYVMDSTADQFTNLNHKSRIFVPPVVFQVPDFFDRLPHGHFYLHRPPGSACGVLYRPTPWPTPDVDVYKQTPNWTNEILNDQLADRITELLWNELSRPISEPSLPSAPLLA